MKHLDRMQLATARCESRHGAITMGFNGTVFAPTNEAFAALVADMGVDTTTLTEETKQLLTAVLVRVAL